MKFALIISRPPTSTASTDTALQFAQSIVSQGHALTRVFFAGKAVTLGSPTEQNLSSEVINAWQQLRHKHNIDLCLCITDFQQLCGQENIQPIDGFTLSGMGQVADICHQCDRVITLHNRQNEK